MSIFNKFKLGKVGVFVTLFAVVLNTMFVVNLPVASAGETDVGLEGAYHDSDHLYALFGMDLGEMAEAIPSLAGNFDLLNENGDSCGVASSASLLASFHDVLNKFVDLMFSTVSCPEGTNPAELKFVDPGNAENYDIAGIEDISALGGGSGPAVSFTSASSITQTSASLTGEIASIADKTITRRGFRIGLDTGYGTDTVSEDNLSGYSTGTYSLSTSALACGNTYYVQAFIMDSDDVEYYGSGNTFSSSSCGGGGGGTYYVTVRAGTQEDSESVNNADVSVGSATCNTGDSDQCSISNLAEGTYTISISAEYYEDYVEENVVVDQAHSSYTAYLTPNYIETVSGTITGPDTSPLSGATVFLLTLDGASIEPTTTSSSGEYSFSDVPENEYLLMAMKDGYVGQYMGPVGFLITNENAGQDIQLAEATTSNSGGVSGVLSVDGVGMANKKVLAFTGAFGSDPWPEILGVGSAETNSLGEFTVSGLDPSDSYILGFFDDFIDYENIGTALFSVSAGVVTSLDYDILTPEMTTSAASSVGQTSVNLNGVIGDCYEINEVGYIGGDNFDAGFEYGTVASATFGTQIQDEIERNDETGVISKGITGLECGTEYQFRAYATNVAGTGVGETLTFTTSSCGSFVSTSTATVNQNDFTLHGTLNVVSPDGFVTRGFEYGANTSYGGTFTENGSWGSGNYSFSSTTINSGIECGVTYHFRAYAISSESVTIYSPDASLTTSSCGGGGGAELDAAYVDGTTFTTIYALFSIDLSAMAEAIASIAGNFSLLDSNSASCATASSASLMASFHDVANKFVQLGFSGISCPDAGNPSSLKFISPGDPEVFDVITIQDVSAIGVVVSNAVTAAETAGNLICQFVDADWQGLSTLGLSMPSSSYNASSSVSSSLTIGSNDAFILIANPTSTATWTLSIAPTDGAGGLWSDGGTNSADFNDDADGSDGDDTDTVGGRLSVDLSGATITPYSGDYSTTGLSVGSNNAFDEGTVDSVTLLTAGGTSNAPGYWGLKGISITQMFPAGQAIGSYSLDLTISVI